MPNVLVQCCIILRHIITRDSTMYCTLNSQSAVHMYLEYHRSGPIVRMGTPNPLSCMRLAPPPPPPGTRGRGTQYTPAFMWGGRGSPDSDDWRKSFALCLLCNCTVQWEVAKKKYGIRRKPCKCRYPSLEMTAKCKPPFLSAYLLLRQILYLLHSDKSD